jgi:hypothetical protein
MFTILFCTLPLGILTHTREDAKKPDEFRLIILKNVPRIIRCLAKETSKAEARVLILSNFTPAESRKNAS